MPPSPASAPQLLATTGMAAAISAIRAALFPPRGLREMRQQQVPQWFANDFKRRAYLRHFGALVAKDTGTQTRTSFSTCQLFSK